MNEKLINKNTLDFIISLIKLLLLLFGSSGIIIALYKYFKRPKIELVTPIEKDLKEFLFSIKFRIRNSSNKGINIRKAQFKIYNTVPQDFDNSIKSLISFKFLKIKEGKRKSAKINDTLLVKEKSETGIFEYNPLITKNKSTEIIVSGMTTDTTGKYSLSLQLISAQRFFFFFHYKTKNFEFKYIGEIPPGILIIGNDKEIVEKIKLQIKTYINSSKSNIKGFFSVRSTISNEKEKDILLKIGKTHKADIILFIDIRKNSKSINLEFKSYNVTNLLKGPLLPLHRFEQSSFTLDKEKSSIKKNIVNPANFIPIILFFHSMVIELSIKHNKWKSLAEQCNVLFDVFFNPAVLSIFINYIPHSSEKLFLNKRINKYLKKNNQIDIWDFNGKYYIKKKFSKDALKPFFSKNEFNIAVLYIHLNEGKKAFYWFCKSSLNNHLGASQNIKIIWTRYVGFDSTLNERAIKHIVSEYDNEVDLEDLKKWLINENKHYKFKSQIDIFLHINKFIKTPYHNKSIDYLLSKLDLNINNTQDYTYTYTTTNNKYS